MNSCDELTYDDAVFREKDKGQWEGLAGRISHMEERVGTLEVQRDGGCGQNEVGASWREAVEQMEMRIKVSIA